MKITNQQRICCSLLAACATFSLTLNNAVSATTDNPPTLTVRYADLDITKPAGAKVLYRRIEKAAQEVCGGISAWDMSNRTRSGACIAHAVSTAVRHVDSPALTALDPSSAPRVASR